MEIGFTARQVTNLTGVPYSTLNVWAKNGLVSPSIASGTGTGSERIYSFRDLVALKVAFGLRKSGVSTSSIKRVIELLRQQEQMAQPLSEARLIVSGSDIAIVRKGDVVSALSRPGQSYLSFVVDLPQILGEIVTIADTTKALPTQSSHLPPWLQAQKRDLDPFTAAKVWNPPADNFSRDHLV